MEVISDIPRLRAHLNGLRRKRRIAFVPTMGALHDGHRSCIDVARAVPDAAVVVSIFVNPAQFGPGEDFDAYPRTRDADLELCRSWGCDVVFTPETSALYPVRQRVWVEVDDLTDPMCGRSRPGHFRGVATVVAKLFNIVGPDVAVFGQKDAQQALVLRETVRQLDMPVELRLARIAREADGLARSSRNVYLDANARPRAAGVFRALTGGMELIESGERDPRVVEGAIAEALRRDGINEIEYVELRSAEDLSPLDVIAGKVILAVAVRVAATRLIDNMVVLVNGDHVSRDVALF